MFFVSFRSYLPPVDLMRPGFSGSHQAGRQHAVSRQRVCLGSGGVGLAAVPCLPLTAALHSRLSDTTSRLHSCDLGLAVGCSACWLWSGVELTECARGSPVGWGCHGCVWALASCLCFVVSFRFLSRPWGGERQTAQRQLPPVVGQYDPW